MDRLTYNCGDISLLTFFFSLSQLAFVSGVFPSTTNAFANELLIDSLME